MAPERQRRAPSWRRLRRCAWRRPARGPSTAVAPAAAASRLDRHDDAFRLAVVGHRFQRRDSVDLVLVRGHDVGGPALGALVDHDALRAEHGGVIDPRLREVDRQDPVPLPRRRHVQSGELEVDLRHARLALLDMAAKLLQVRGSVDGM